METADRREYIYKTYHPRVLSYVRSKTGACEAEDLTSDIFLKVFQALDGYDETKASMSTWIYTIARNRVYDFFRARRIETIPYDDDIRLDECARAGDEDALLEKLDRALDALTERQREIIILRYRFNFSHKEIASRMGLSYVNARQICFTATTALKKRMEREK